MASAGFGDGSAEPNAANDAGAGAVVEAGLVASGNGRFETDIGCARVSMVESAVEAEPGKRFGAEIENGRLHDIDADAVSPAVGPPEAG